MSKLGKSALIKNLTDAIRKGGWSDRQIRVMVESLWRDPFSMRTSGFDLPGGTDAEIFWNDLTRTFTIQPVNFFEQETPGVKFAFYTFTTSLNLHKRYTYESIQIPEEEGLFAIFYDQDPETMEYVLYYVKNPTSAEVAELYLAKVIVTWIYYIPFVGAVYFGDSRHGSEWIPAIHWTEHVTLNSRREIGIAIVDAVYNGDGSDDSHFQFGISEGVLWHEDFSKSLAAVSSTQGLPVWYFNAQGLPRYTVQAGKNFLNSGLVAYNPSGDITPAGEEKFVLYHLFATNCYLQPHISAMGRDQYSYIADAYAAIEAEMLQLRHDLPHESLMHVGTVIIQTSALYTNSANARLVTWGNQGVQGVQGVQGSQGNQGVQGVQGSQGSQGNDGTGITILGSVPSNTNLPGYPDYYNGDVGDGYLADDSGHLWVWDGDLWIDAGEIRGPQGIQGAQGSQGLRGYQGYQGSIGSQGSQGSQGHQGVRGYQGYQGDDGAPGPQGATGAQGVKGDQGETGTKGDQGDQGATGAQGATGQQGPRGYQGHQGFTGSEGSQGEVGATGDQGPQGATGPQGVKGDQGAVGTQGETGATGPQGAIGDQGDMGFDGEKGDQGPQGYQGLRGYQGYQGSIGSQGNQGSQGHQGDQGNQGGVGPQGNQGVQGSQGLRGYQGYQGSIGSQGNQGSQGHQGAQGAQGSQGHQGNQGNQGNQGVRGYQGYQGTQGTPANEANVLWETWSNSSSNIKPKDANAIICLGEHYGALGFNVGYYDSAWRRRLAGYSSYFSQTNDGKLEIRLAGDGTQGSVISSWKIIELSNADGTIKASNFILNSQRSLKENISPISDIKAIDAIEFFEFFFKDDESKRKRYGVIAEDIEGVAPELVYTDNNGGKTVAYIDLLVAKVARLEERIKKLEGGK
jgi:hypothetical protein